MSIILEGIDLPPNAKVELIVKSPTESFRKQIPKSKVIQIPKGHGRLIDADALELEKEVELADDWKTAHEIANCVKYAPTILEEEEVDEHNTERD